MKSVVVNIGGRGSLLSFQEMVKCLLMCFTMSANALEGGQDFHSREATGLRDSHTLSLESDVAPTCPFRALNNQGIKNLLICFPASFQFVFPVSKSPVADSRFLAGVSSAQSLSLKNNPCGLTGVFLLVQNRNPSAVFFVIPERVFSSLQRESGRAFPHVVQEVFEISPPFVESDSFSSVVMKGCVLRIETPRLHLYPSRVGPSPFSGSMTMFTFSRLRVGFHFEMMTHPLMCFNTFYV